MAPKSKSSKNGSKKPTDPSENLVSVWLFNLVQQIETDETCDLVLPPELVKWFHTKQQERHTAYQVLLQKALGKLTSEEVAVLKQNWKVS